MSHRIKLVARQDRKALHHATCKHRLQVRFMDGAARRATVKESLTVRGELDEAGAVVKDCLTTGGGRFAEVGAA